MISAMGNAPFVVLCPLVPEAAAARAGLARRKSRGRVYTTGMGPASAGGAATSLASRIEGGVPVIVAGVGGSLVTGLRRGEVVVADSLGEAGYGAGGELVVRHPPAALDAASAALADQVAAALRRRSHPARRAPVLGVPRMVRGDERDALALSSAAIVCDMESYWLSGLAEHHPFCVVRVVADSPGRELFSLHMLADGAASLWRLAGVTAAIASLFDAASASRPASTRRFAASKP